MPPESAVDLSAGHQDRPHVAQVLAARRAPSAAAARGNERRDDMVARREIAYARPDLGNDARALVAADQRKRSGTVAGAEMMVGVAETGRLERNQDFTLGGWIEFDFLDAPGLVDTPQHGSMHLHGDPPTC